MAIDSNFTTTTEIRLLTLENGMTDLLRLLNKCVGQEQFNRINVVLQKQIALLTTKIDEVEAELIRLDQLYDELL